MSELKDKLLELYNHLHNQAFPKYINENELEHRTSEFNTSSSDLDDIFLPSINEQNNPTNLWGYFPNGKEKEVGIYFVRLDLMEEQFFEDSALMSKDAVVEGCPPFLVYVWSQDSDWKDETLTGYLGTFDTVLQRRHLGWSCDMEFKDFFDKPGEEWEYAGYTEEDNFMLGLDKDQGPTRIIFGSEGYFPEFREEFTDFGIHSEFSYDPSSKRNTKQSTHHYNKYRELVEQAYNSFLEILHKSRPSPNEEQPL